MLKDLSIETQQPINAEVDGVVVGAGIAGLILARELSLRGVSCVVLESGGHNSVECDPLLSDVDLLRRKYAGATEGRCRGLGGTSVKWGGALLPFRDADFALRPDLGHPGWPIPSDTLAPYLRSAEQLFGLDHDAYEVAFPCSDQAGGFIPREAKWPGFRNRNLALLCRKMIEAKHGPEIWLNATVRGFALREGRVESVSARSQTGRLLTVRAREFVLCAGAIESTRLLLLLDRQTEGKVIIGREHLGLYFQDHLSVPLARVEATDPRALNSLVGFRFQGAIMRSLRFERNAPGASGGFVHIAPRSLAPTGFDAVREVMRGLQRRKLDLKALWSLSRFMPYLLRLVWWRTVRRRLLWPEPSVYDLHVVVEQHSSQENRIVLGARSDELGDPVVALDWGIGERDLESFQELSEEFSKYWAASGLSSYGELIWSAPLNDKDFDSLKVVSDIYHPVGTTRMANSAKEGVVDSDLRVFGIDNLSLAATSVFPSGGSANPTLTLVLLTLRLADRFCRDIAKR